MYKKIFKILVTIIFAVIVVISMINVSLATNNFNFSQFDNNTNADADKVAQNAMGTAINIIRIVGTGTSIIMIIYLGIKYMMAAPSEKADFKKSASIFILGAVLIFAATNILAIIADFTASNIS